MLFSVCFLSALAERFADIFFLVDSGVTPADFQQIRTILSRLVNQLNVGAAAYRLGLAQYGPSVKVEFLLNAHRTKEETQNAVKRFRQRKLQPDETRDLGFALRHASTNFFTREKGSRADKGYRQYLVVLSGEDSDDSVARDSNLIKSLGVTVIGMSVGASLRFMHLIATPPHIYKSITNAAPTLKAIFENDQETTTFTNGEKVHLVCFYF